MNERPILFSGAAMVRALLAGQKTVTRRIVRPQPERFVAEGGAVHWGGRLADGSLQDVEADALGRFRARCPYGAVGDALWCRETWCPGDQWVDTAGYDHDPPSTIRYRADNAAVRYPNTPGAHALSTKGWSDPKRWRPAIFMPRWASRLTLRVTDVRVERLQAITEDEARAEGVAPFHERYRGISPDQRLTSGERAVDSPYRASFAVLWDELNADRASWLCDPFVWVVAFERVTADDGR